MLADYSEMEKDINDAPDPTILPRGSEVKARIIGVLEGVSDKNDAQWYMPNFDVPGQPLVMEFNDFFWDLLEKSKVEPKQYAKTLSKFKKFATAFGLDYSRPFDWIDDLIGLEGWVILGVRKSDEYGDQNSVSKYVVGK